MQFEMCEKFNLFWYIFVDVFIEILFKWLRNKSIKRMNINQ